MKTLLVLLFAILPTSVFAGQYESSYQVGPDKYTLKLTTREIATSGGKGSLVSYSVYENGKFSYADENDGDHLYSCDAEREEPTVAIIKTNKRPIGWMIQANGICGNTFSYLEGLVIPYNTGFSYEYLSKHFISKVDPILEPSDGNLTILFFQQNWGKGGTASSIFVPHVLIINGAAIKNGDVLSKLDLFPNAESYLSPTFLGLYVAGLEDLNPDLMSYALKNLYNEKDKDWYTEYGLPSDKAELEKLVNKIGEIKRTYDYINPFVDWGPATD